MTNTVKITTDAYNEHNEFDDNDDNVYGDNNGINIDTNTRRLFALVQCADLAQNLCFLTKLLKLDYTEKNIYIYIDMLVVVQSHIRVWRYALYIECVPLTS